MNDILSIITTVMRASSHRFIGRLARDPEIKFFESGKCVANTRMAVNQLGAKQGDGKEPDWFKLEVWGDSAQGFCDQFRKGDLVEVVGRVKTSRWTDRSTGEERMELVVAVEEWRAVRPAGAPPAAPAQAAAPAAAWADALDDDDIPF